MLDADRVVVDFRPEALAPQKRVMSEWTVIRS